MAANLTHRLGKRVKRKSSKQAVDDDGNPIYRNDRGRIDHRSQNAQGKKTTQNNLLQVGIL